MPTNWVKQLPERGKDIKMLCVLLWPALRYRPDATWIPGLLERFRRSEPCPVHFGQDQLENAFFRPFRRSHAVPIQLFRDLEGKLSKRITTSSDQAFSTPVPE